MKFNKVIFPLLAIATPLTTNAMTAFDTRSVGMGGTGVASANYLTSSFHNPALSAAYGEQDSFGMILPMIGARVHDGDSAIDKLDHFQYLDDNLGANPSEEALEQWREALRDLDNGTVNAEVNLGMVFAIPNRYLSTNFFVKSQVSVIAAFDIDENDLALNDPSNSELNSRGQAIGGATVDVGFTFGHEFELNEKPLFLGVSPKYQRIYAVNYIESVDDFDDDDFDWADEYIEKSAFNIDIGAAYQLNDKTMVGLTGRNLIKHTLEANPQHGMDATYIVNPEYVMGIAHDRGWVNLAADVDLNAKKYFKEYGYKTQYARLGAELDAWGWAQVRMGYMHSMTDYADDMATLGLGFRPFGLLGIDLGAQIGKDDNYGVSAQMMLTF
ncbi:conjugal transfer protein TraF [Photobacterium sp. DNB23_23_1]|uniref:Conjugal transfer protein TraF n=1 Tax=Photobacterium pectinilyticum TaxID=2906793 RepID=A0ABT1N1W0_9GAMM|nr:conjugal transfer protein TraF [Photobacterium sp. ZSDE20]MCQ1058723.1 conjugal transfer protein TraF [Photobacterium sp. ZSDE20]MDD1823505.1 conjugal transfer protein TraF [Photobacterium sp. ZSDE20]